jgi:rubrerythrin
MPLFTFGPQRAFSELSDREVLALAVQAEEEDGRLYREFAESLKADYPESAKVFVEMAEEETSRVSSSGSRSG